MTRSSRAAGVLAALLIAVVGGACSESAPANVDSDASSTAPVPYGRYVEGDSITSNGTIRSATPRRGGEYWFSLPTLFNHSRSTVTVESFTVRNVSQYAQILGYTTFDLSVKELHGYPPAFWDTAVPYPPNPPGLHLDEPHYRSKLPFILPAGRSATTVGVVKVRLKDSAAALAAARNFMVGLSGCTVTYRVGNERFRQNLNCSYGFGSEP